MPITKSAKKALKQNIKRRAINLKRKNQMKKMIKNLTELIGNLEKNAEKMTSENIKDIYGNLSLTYKAIDKAAKRGVIKKNTASRKKSRLARKINSLSGKSKK